MNQRIVGNGLLINCTIGICFLGACKEPPKQTLSPKWKPIIDSVFAEKKPLFEAKADTICLERFDSLYNLAFDSILSVRLEEIQKLTQ